MKNPAIRGLSIMEKNLIVILGPTASGKTSLAVRLAREFDGEIISADSRQVYRGMDLGTGKDLSEYEMENRAIPYHLINVIDPVEEFNLFEFQRLLVQSFLDITGRKKWPILVGGTGLYLESVVLNYRLRKVGEDRQLRERLAVLDMDALRGLYLSFAGNAPHNKTDMTDRSRLVRAIEILSHARDASDASDLVAYPEISPIVIGVRWERSELRRRITRRLRDRIDAGLIGEVRRLKEEGLSWERLDAFGLEYRYISLFLRGILTEEEMFKTLETRIHQFAKRQDTWFRRMERKGVDIHWINGHDYEEMKEYIHTLL
jgi:tRNA dimethylallyltransferase